MAGSKGSTAAAAKLDPRWSKFVRNYPKDGAYWYIPKGLSTADLTGLRRKLEVLSSFEGKSWRPNQSAYIAALNAHGLSKASAGSKASGGAAMARMIKQVFGLLGVAWVDGKDLVELTDAGRQFLSSADYERVVAQQIARYQFSNPSLGAAEGKGIQINPLAFLGEVLRTLPDRTITKTEYTLFVAKAKSFEDADVVVEDILEFRDLSPAARAKIVTSVDSYMVGGSKRTSLFNTIGLSAGYAFSFWGNSASLQADPGKLTLDPAHSVELRRYLENHVKRGAFIEFANEKDWMAYYGDPLKMPTIDTALEYYVDRSDVEAAVKLKRQSGAGEGAVKAFKEVLVSEKTIEDFLFANIGQLDGVLGSKLKMIGRQYSTTVGPIDLLTKDQKTGEFVVVELKKDRAPDKVFGQLSRYMGWVRKNLAGGKPVRGVVVSRTIDTNLKSARDAHDTKIELVEFGLSFGAKTV